MKSASADHIARSRGHSNRTARGLHIGSDIGADPGAPHDPDAASTPTPKNRQTDGKAKTPHRPAQCIRTLTDEGLRSRSPPGVLLLETIERCFR